FVTTTTHKTLRGPRGGAILCKSEFAQQIDKAIFPGIQGGPLMHVIAGKAVCFKEALTDEFKKYQEQIVKNAKALADALLDRGFDLVSGGTDNHLVLIDLSKKNLTGKEVEKNLDDVGITTNKNTIPNDPKGPFVTSGIRLGTPAMTTRGLKEEDFEKIAEAIDYVINHKDDTAYKSKTEAIIKEICTKYPVYK
ncbi:MAG: serine hydroxymethyltransferase, partial [Peptostreptococcales bacterium]